MSYDSIKRALTVYTLSGFLICGCDLIGKKQVQIP